MKILSVTWNIYDERLEPFMKNCTGGGLAIRNICEYLGRIADSYLLLGQVLLPEMRLGNINIVKSDYNVDIKKAKGKDEAYIQYMTSVFVKAVAEIKPDIINFHGYGDFAFSCIENVCIPQNLLYVVTAHLFIGRDDLTRFDGYEGNVAYANILYNIPNIRVIAVSHGMKKKIHRDFPLLQDQQVKTIANGTDFCAEYVDSELSKKYKTDCKKIFLCVGTLLGRKNQMQILRAFGQRPDLKEKVKVIFCGKDGMDGALQKEIEKNHMSNALIYVGAVSSDEMKKYYSIADGLLMPSYAEGLSIAALEAIAYGLPIVMFADSECAEDLNDNKVVCWAQERSDECLAKAIAECCETKWDREYIKNYAKYFSMERMAQDYMEYYKSLLNAII